jgi:hypothetical protein
MFEEPAFPFELTGWIRLVNGEFCEFSEWAGAGQLLANYSNYGQRPCGAKAYSLELTCLSGVHHPYGVAGQLTANASPR